MQQLNRYSIIQVQDIAEGFTPFFKNKYLNDYNKDDSQRIDDAKKIFANIMTSNLDDLKKAEFRTASNYLDSMKMKSTISSEKAQFVYDKLSDVAKLMLEQVLSPKVKSAKPQAGILPPISRPNSILSTSSTMSSPSPTSKLTPVSSTSSNMSISSKLTPVSSQDSIASIFSPTFRLPLTSSSSLNGIHRIYSLKEVKDIASEFDLSFETRCQTCTYSDQDIKRVERAIEVLKFVPLDFESKIDNDQKFKFERICNDLNFMIQKISKRSFISKDMVESLRKCFAEIIKLYVLKDSSPTSKQSHTPSKSSEISSVLSKKSSVKGGVLKIIQECISSYDREKHPSVEGYCIMTQMESLVKSYLPDAEEIMKMIKLEYSIQHQLHDYQRKKIEIAKKEAKILTDENELTHFEKFQKLEFRPEQKVQKTINKKALERDIINLEAIILKQEIDIAGKEAQLKALQSETADNWLQTSLYEVQTEKDNFEYRIQLEEYKAELVEDDYTLSQLEAQIAVSKEEMENTKVRKYKARSELINTPLAEVEHLIAKAKAEIASHKAKITKENLQLKRQQSETAKDQLRLIKNKAAMKMPLDSTFDCRKWFQNFYTLVSLGRKFQPIEPTENKRDS